MAKSLRVNVLWALSGNAVFAASQWALIILIAKYFTPLHVGEYSLALAIAGPLFMLSAMQLRSLHASDSANKHTFGEYLFLRCLTSLLAALAVVLIGLFGQYAHRQFLIILIIVGFKSIDSIADSIHGHFQRNQRLELMALAQILRAGLSLPILLLALEMNSGFPQALLGVGAAYLTILLFFELPMLARLLRDQPPFQFNKLSTRLGKLFLMAYPLGIMSLLVSLNANVPRYVVESAKGAHELGIYAALAYSMMAGQLVVSSICNSALPRLADFQATGNRTRFVATVVKLLQFMTVVSLIKLALIYWFGRPILALLYTPEYSEFPDVFLLLALAGCLSYFVTIGECALMALNRIKVQPLMVFSGVVATTLVSILLVPVLGMLGAGLALTASALVRLLFVGAYIQHQRPLFPSGAPR